MIRITALKIMARFTAALDTTKVLKEPYHKVLSLLQYHVQPWSEEIMLVPVHQQTHRCRMHQLFSSYRTQSTYANLLVFAEYPRLQEHISAMKPRTYITVFTSVMNSPIISSLGSTTVTRSSLLLIHFFEFGALTKSNVELSSQKPARWVMHCKEVDRGRFQSIAKRNQRNWFTIHFGDECSEETFFR